MEFEEYKRESTYDSSKNIINDEAAEQIKRIKQRKIGAMALDIFRI